jgi:hypothetical protein
MLSRIRRMNGFRTTRRRLAEDVPAIGVAAGRTAVLCTVLLLPSWGCASARTPPPQFAQPGGQDTRSWDAVLELDRGQDIAVRLTAGGEIPGTFETADSDALTMSSDSGRRTIARDEVQSIDARVLETSSKGKYMILGAAVGAGAALVALALFCEVGNHDCSTVQQGPMLTPIGAGIGALWGRAFGQPATMRRVRVYTRSE